MPRCYMSKSNPSSPLKMHDKCHKVSHSIRQSASYSTKASDQNSKQDVANAEGSSLTNSRCQIIKSNPSSPLTMHCQLSPLIRTSASYSTRASDKCSKEGWSSLLKKLIPYLGYALVCGCAGTVVWADEGTDEDESTDETKRNITREQFEAWMKRYDMSYSTEEEKEKSFLVFKERAQYLRFCMQKCDEDRYNCMRLAAEPLAVFKFAFSYTSPKPASIDWRNKGAVTPVKRLHKCGGCWAAAVVESVDGLHQIETGNLIKLSVQQLIECDKRNKGCLGGSFEKAFKYVQEHGLTSEEDYPLHHYRINLESYFKRTCRADGKAIRAQIGGFIKVPNNEQCFMSAVCINPMVVVVTIKDDNIFSYDGGIMTIEEYPPPKSGEKYELHAVLLLAYGTTEDGIDFWLLKNHWGILFGKLGYFAVERKSEADEQGALGIYYTPGGYPHAIEKKGDLWEQIDGGHLSARNIPEPIEDQTGADTMALHGAILRSPKQREEILKALEMLNIRPAGIRKLRDHSGHNSEQEQSLDKVPDVKQINMARHPTTDQETNQKQLSRK